MGEIWVKIIVFDYFLGRDCVKLDHTEKMGWD